MKKILVVIFLSINLNNFLHSMSEEHNNPSNLSSESLLFGASPTSFGTSPTSFETSPRPLGGTSSASIFRASPSSAFKSSPLKKITPIYKPYPIAPVSLTNQPDDCSICYDPLIKNQINNPLTTTTCNHVFHKDCLDQWFANKEACPICRHKTPSLLFSVKKGNLLDVILILKKEININEQDKDGNTALHLAASRGYLEIIIELLKHNAKVYLQNVDSNSPLHLAALNKHPEIIIELLRCNPKIASQKNIKGNTALHEASYHGDTKTLAALLKYQAKYPNINLQNNTGDTALQITICNDTSGSTKLSNVNLLISKDADIAAKNNSGKTALDLARERNYLIIASLLEKQLNHTSANADNASTTLAFLPPTAQVIPSDKNKCFENEASSNNTTEP